MYKRILLATDFSEGCQALYQQAAQLTKEWAAELTLLHVVEPIPTYGYPGVIDLETPMIEAASEMMCAIGATYGIPDNRLMVEMGSIKATVLKIAASLNSDLIIIGSHGRHGISHLLGSNASAIMQGAICDVLTVRCAG